MKSMLFAAGLGTRLRPLTHDRPKALVEVRGRPLLEWAIRRLIRAGSREIIVNVHHFADRIEAFLEDRDSFGIRIEVSDEREKLLETGGGLKKARWFFDDDQPFLVSNTDILTDLDLRLLYHAHIKSGALATLAVRSRETSRYLLFDKEMQLRGWKNTRTGEVRPPAVPTKHLQAFAFSGIQVLSPAIFGHMPDDDKFSIIDVYLHAMTKAPVLGYLHNEGTWLDVGKPESLKKAEDIRTLPE